MPVKTTRRLIAATATSLAFVLALAACSDSAPTEPGENGPENDADESEGALVVYSGRAEDLIGPIIDDFIAETGVEVDVRYGSTPELAAQLIEEGASSPADVYLGQDAGSLGAISAEGLFSTLPDQTLERVPSEYRAEDGSWIGLSGRSRVLVYSGASVEESELPASIFELTEPQWEGRVGIAPTNASFQSFVTALRVSEGEDVASEWLTGLAENTPQIFDGNGGIVADVDADAVDVGLVNHYYLYGTAAEQGVDIDDLNVTLHFFSGGDIGGLLNVSGVGIVGDGADGAALDLVNFLLGTTAQEFFRDDNSEYPVVPGIEPSPHLPSLAELDIPDIDLNDLGDLQRTVELIAEAGLA